MKIGLTFEGRERTMEFTGDEWIVRETVVVELGRFQTREEAVAAARGLVDGGGEEQLRVVVEAPQPPLHPRHQYVAPVLEERPVRALERG